MAALLVTGRLAEAKVRQIARSHGCKVYTAPTDVAALIKPRALARQLKERRDLLRGVEVILLPGMVLGDVAAVEKATGVRTYLGPRDLLDLDEVLRRLGKIRLSKTRPADRLLLNRRRDRAVRELAKVEASSHVERLLQRPGNFRIGGVAVGPDFPARVVAEIVEAEALPDREVLRRAEYYREQGADIVDIGMNRSDPDRAAELVGLLRTLGAPVSIDTMEKENIEAALRAGVDLVLSFNHELIQEFRDLGTACVVVPEKNGHIPRDPSERVRLLLENVSLALERGFSRVIPDPLLQPVSMGFVDSLAAYREFRRHRGREMPMLMGVGNVTELMDADSPGINALLAGAAMEVGASLLFTTEAGDKTRGCVAELARAAKMMYLSSKWGCMPRDLGMDLLILKEKKLRRDVLDSRIMDGVRQVVARGGKEDVQMDRRGFFRIFVDEMIRCIHYRGGKPHVAIVGSRAGDVCDTILDLGLVEELGHAMYLGRELARAEEALVYNKSYRQA
jgi:dihydropteroate synthase-like protein